MTIVAAPAPLTFTFDAENQLDLDAYLPSVAASEAASANELKKVPVLVYFHGGAILSGSKNDVFFPHWFKTALLPRGILVISANYRLLFPSTPADIIADVHTLFSYISSPTTPLASALSAAGLAVDEQRIIVNGGSGGNYPARAAATLPTVLPRPAGWFNSFGQGGDFLLDFWLTPQDVDVSMPFTQHGPERAAELLAQGGGPVVSDDPIQPNKEGKLVDEHFRWSLFVEAARDGTYLDLFFKQPGLSAKLAALPYAERLAAIPEEKRGWLLPITPATTRSFVQHGTGDIMVPCDESRKTEKDMKALGLDVEVDWIEGAAHAFFNLDPEGEEMKGLLDRSVVWIEKALKEVK
ncbi:hypothetical protein IAT38_001000 [Cryptococcus sp. DSM 104549]